MPKRTPHARNLSESTIFSQEFFQEWKILQTASDVAQQHVKWWKVCVSAQHETLLRHFETLSILTDKFFKEFDFFNYFIKRIQIKTRL